MAGKWDIFPGNKSTILGLEPLFGSDVWHNRSQWCDAVISTLSLYIICKNIIWPPSSKTAS